MSEYALVFGKLAKYLSPPLIIVGLSLVLYYSFQNQLLQSGLLKQITQKESGETIKRSQNYSFILGLVLIALGFGLAILNVFY
jgi:di/tricarboxylate transporter